MQPATVFVREQGSFMGPAGAVLAFALILVLAGPIGYRGGGGDDFQYLEAARCAARHGLCVPQSHWWSRMPLVLPMGAALALFGEARAPVAAVPLCYGLCAVLLLTRLVFDRYDAKAATIAGLVLLATPVFSDMLLYPNIDLAELTFLLLALTFLQKANAGGKTRWTVLTGVSLALAVQCRPSALCALPLFALYAFWDSRSWKRLGVMVLAFVAWLSLEAIAYGVLIGDPFLPWRLALAHGSVPSTELSPDVDTSRGPLFNPQYIGGWNPAAGIHAHWTISGLVNLLASVDLGVTLIVALIVLALSRQQKTTPPDPVPIILIAASAFYFGGLVYALAVDPKPRMFMPVAAAAAAVCGISGANLWRSGRTLVPTAVVLGLGLFGLVLVADVPDFRRSDRIAQKWLDEESGRVAMDQTTANALTLVRSAQGSTHNKEATSRLKIGDRSCAANLADLTPSEGWRIARTAPIPTTLDQLLGRAPARDRLNLCLFRRDPAATPPA